MIKDKQKRGHKEVCRFNFINNQDTLSSITWRFNVIITIKYSHKNTTWHLSKNHQ